MFCDRTGTPTNELLACWLAWSHCKLPLIMGSKLVMSGPAPRVEPTNPPRPAPAPPDPALVPAVAAPHVQALVTTGSVGVSDALMAAMPRLSLVCCYGTGYERIDLAAARKKAHE